MEDIRTSAGNFSTWLNRRREDQLRRKLDVEVPCGSCTACCRSSLFIHIKPHETVTVKHIPKGLLFPAPGLPKGNVLLGYDENGKCPMFIDNKCSIYEFRPETCREFDCRIFAATAIYMDNAAQVLISERARSWYFDYDGDKSREDHATVRASAKFLKEKSHLFPDGLVPKNPTQLALLAIRVFRVFSKLGEASGTKTTDAEIVKQILKEISTR